MTHKRTIPRDLFVYHPGTGTIIPLSDEVYLCAASIIDPTVLDNMEDGATTHPSQHLGMQIDNFNMFNLFYGEED